jgi:hypothetical protein
MTALAEHINLDAPVVKKGERSITYRFKVAERDDGDTVYADLRIGHRKAGPNYFNGEYIRDNLYTVTLKNVAVEPEGGIFSVEKFQVFKGIGLTSYDAGKRYSAKKLQEAAEQGLAELRQRVEDGDERVLRYFAPDAEE